MIISDVKSRCVSWEMCGNTGQFAAGGEAVICLFIYNLPWRMFSSFSGEPVLSPGLATSLVGSFAFCTRGVYFSKTRKKCRLRCWHGIKRWIKENSKERKIKNWNDQPEFHRSSLYCVMPVLNTGRGVFNFSNSLRAFNSVAAIVWFVFCPSIIYMDKNNCFWHLDGVLTVYGELSCTITLYTN